MVLRRLSKWWSLPSVKRVKLQGRRKDLGPKKETNGDTWIALPWLCIILIVNWRSLPKRFKFGDHDDVNYSYFSNWQYILCTVSIQLQPEGYKDYWSLDMLDCEVLTWTRHSRPVVTLMHAGMTLAAASGSESFIILDSLTRSKSCTICRLGAYKHWHTNLKQDTWMHWTVSYDRLGSLFAAYLTWRARWTQFSFTRNISSCEVAQACPK